MLNFLVALSLSSFALADRITSAQTTFNKTCPAPKMCDDFIESYDVCEQEKKRCNEFLENFKKLLPKYDCQRPQDATPKEKYIVPAMWLCKDHEDAVRFLSQMKTVDARRLFGSAMFRTILDGDLARELSALSIKVGKEFPPPPTTGAFWIPSKNFEATEVEKKEVEAWFAKYAEFSENNDIEGLAGMVQFPLQVVSRDAKGSGGVQSWNKDNFVKVMKGVLAKTPDDTESKSEHTPYFLSHDLVIIMTKTSGKSGGQKNIAKSADVLVRVGGKWMLQVTAQPGRAK